MATKDFTPCDSVLANANLGSERKDKRTTAQRREEKARYYKANAERMIEQQRVYRQSKSLLTVADPQEVKPSTELTAERLRWLMTYDELTGHFTNRRNRGTRSLAGARVGYLSPNGYIFICVDKVLYRAHRLAWLYVFGTWPEIEIDHINRVKTDNRIANLRDVSRSDNNTNHTKAQPSSRTGVRGVFKRGERFHAQITKHRRSYLLGSFATLQEAELAYLSAKDKVFGPIPDHCL